MKKYHIAAAYALSMALLSAMPAGARQLTPEEALGRIQSEQPHRVPAKSNLNISTQTIEDEGKPSFYVFSQSGVPGYIIAPADDRLPSVIGYTDKGEFEYDLLPSPVKWLLDLYRQPSAITASSLRSAYQAVSPLMNTEWGQKYPYNAQCPNTGYGENCPAGCVAVAMAQVMHYYRYPAKLGDADAQYEKMPVTLSKYSPKEEIDHVAMLMSLCGQAVEMDYNNFISLAYNQKIPSALTDTFGYDKSARFEMLNYYSTNEWMEMIYNELKAKRPVIMSGMSDSEGGHTFVCDGIDSDGLLHINWGWQGLSNGYYNLTALNPTQQGTGGTDEAYTYDFGLVTHIIPSKGGEPYYPIYGKEGTVYNTNSNRITSGGVCNYSYHTFKGTLGLIAVDSEGHEHVTATQITHEFKPLANSAAPVYAITPNMKPSNLQPGEYRVYIAVKPDGREWVKARSPYTMPQYVRAVVDNSGNITYHNSEAPYAPEIKTESIIHSGLVIPGEKSIWKITMYNTGIYQFNNNITLHFLSRDNHKEVKVAEYKNVTIDGGCSRYISPNISLDLAPGKYEVYVNDCYGRKTCEPRPIYVGKPETEVQSISIIDRGDDVTDSRTRCKLGERFTLTATVLPEGATDKAIYWISSRPDVATVDNNGNVRALTLGSTVITAYSVDGSDIESDFELTVDPEVEVTDIELNKYLIEGGIGDTFQLTATVLPEDADDKRINWSSDDDEIATVSGTGVVTINSDGETRIEASSESDFMIKAYCIVRGTAGLGDLIADTDLVDIYSVEGVLLKSGVRASAADELPRGIYIVKSPTTTIKISR